MSLTVTVSPHIKSKESVQSVMLDVIISLIPATILAIWFFKLRSLIVILVCIISCCLTEYLAQKIMRRENTVSDLSAAVTGLLLAFCLPPSTPFWIAGIGGMFSIIFGKTIFGGLGHNPFNPALVGRAFLQLSWPKDTSVWTTPFDALTTATPLSITRYGLEGKIPDTFSLFIGNCAGCIGETSKLALIIGALYLLYRKHIKLHIPLSYIITAIIVSVLFKTDPVFHILTGGLVLGAFFMATDPVTSPVTDTGKIIFGIGCGLLTILIRLKGGFPEGVCYSILIMNMVTPFIDKITIRKRFGA
jgi:electron transport complex protein RnfD